jgi:hypothetical protein
MSLLDKLLQADVKALTEKPTKKYEVKRLSKKLGCKFEMSLVALDGQLLAEITEDNTQYTKSGKVKNVNNYKIGLEVIVNGCTEPNFKSKELMEKFGVHTPYEVVDKLFLPAEMGNIAAEITKLCGVENQNETDEQVKN